MHIIFSNFFLLEILWQLILSMRINLGIIIKNNTYFWYSCNYQSDKGAQDYFCIIFILGIFHPVLFIQSIIQYLLQIDYHISLYAQKSPSSCLFPW